MEKSLLNESSRERGWNLATRDGIYRWKDRPGYWISWTGAQGRRRYRKTAAATLAPAPNARAAELIKVEQSRILGFAPPSDDSFADLATRYLAHQKVRLTAQSFERVKLIAENHLKPAVSGPVKAIGKVEVQRYVTDRSGKTKPASVAKELTTLKHMLCLAAGRVRHLQATELRVVMEACPQWLRPVVSVAVSTGMRRGEILSLRWLDVDMTHRCLMLHQTKNGGVRIVHLNICALDALRSIPVKADAKSADRLLPGVSPEQVSVAFQRVARTAKIADFHFDDLRRTLATWLRQRDTYMDEIAVQLGHRDLRMTRRYARVASIQVEVAVNGLDSVLGDELSHPIVTAKAELPEAVTVIH